MYSRRADHRAAANYVTLRMPVRTARVSCGSHSSIRGAGPRFLYEACHCRIFEDVKGGITDADYLVQGTLYPDIIRAVTSDDAMTTNWACLP